MKILGLYLATWLLSTATAQQKNTQVGGPCEGCEAVFEYGSKKLSPHATLPDHDKPGPKLKITGIIYHRDGVTPAKDVILYIYHTDQTGEYPTRGDETGWDKRHGYLRGWIKTDATGKYSFQTLKPAPYPGRDAPAHIHATVKEPDKNEYWIDEYLFEGDPLLTPSERKHQMKRGGNGIITLTRDKEDTFIGDRNIVLGLNIPGYP